MKTTSRMLIKLICVIVILFTVSVPFLKAFAGSGGGGSAWGEFLNSDGSINWSNLNYLGEVSKPADWMKVEVPVGIQVPLGQATYNRYMTPSGNILVLPSPATMFMTFLHPQASGLAANTPQMLQSGSQVMAALATNYMNLQELHSLGYVDPVSFFQDVIDGHANIWSVVMPTFLIEIARMSLDSGFLVTGLWLYLNGADCATIPGGCPLGFGLTPTPVGTSGTPTPPPAAACPPPHVAYGPVTAEGEKTAPLKPVVVGQDPQKRGVDVKLSVTIPPVIYTWYEAHKIHICQYSSDVSGGGCSGPGNRYDRVIDAQGGSTHWDVSMQGNSNWKASSQTVCLKHVEVFPDYLDYASLSISLSPVSRQWILSNLSQAYPNATLKHPDWNYSFFGPGSPGGNKVVSWSQLIPGIQVADPGDYLMQISGLTSGTPVSAPRSFNLPLNPFAVSLLRVTLIEAP